MSDSNLKFSLMPPFVDDQSKTLQKFVATWDFWPYSAIMESIRSYTAKILVAEDSQNEWVGLIIFGLQGDSAEIFNIYVPEKKRKHGIATALLAELTHYLGQEGCHLLFLEVRPSNTPAIAVYRRCGFVEVGRRRGYYQDGEDALMMKRSLN